jgi:periplasmic divalent cation tolerance protein
MSSPSVRGLLALTTLPDADSAERVGRTLVERRLAACASLLGGVRSIYRWQGAVEQATEVLVLLKTSADRREELERALLELHPYQVPELIFLDPDRVAPAYLAWLGQETERS